MVEASPLLAIGWTVAVWFLTRSDVAGIQPAEEAT